MKTRKTAPGYTQRGLAWGYDQARDMLDYHFDGIGYVYNFGSYWAVYTR